MQSDVSSPANQWLFLASRLSETLGQSLSHNVSSEGLKSAQSLSPTALAYIGDAVYELYVRTHYLLPARRISDYHQQVVAEVRAEQQAVYLSQIEPLLTQQEQDIVKRGRNAVVNKPKRLTADIYQRATSLESLIGYLYLHNPSRLYELFDYLFSSHS